MNQQQFTGLEAIKIMCANHYGLDKETFQHRIKWFDENKKRMVFEGEIITPIEAEKPILMAKALSAYHDAVNGIPSGYMCELDATASGIQIMAALSGCVNTAYEVNMINPDERVDLYNNVAASMTERIDERVERSDVKKPVMTHYYNSKETPKLYLNTKKLQAFYKVLEGKFTGAEEVMQAINNCWNPSALAHTWTLPDGHVAHCKTMTYKKGETYIPEYDIDLEYVYWVNEGNHNFRSLAPNVIHSIDGYVARQMVRRAADRGFELVHIHDCFMFHPNYFNDVTEMYRQILAGIAEWNLLANILSELQGKKISITKSSEFLPAYIRDSQYMLS